VEPALLQALDGTDPAAARLQQAMRYSVLGGGKRLRPLLVYITGDAFGARPADLDAPAAAVELIHAYSLIHDDLPAMDDDDLRRGLPTCRRWPAACRGRPRFPAPAASSARCAPTSRTRCRNPNPRWPSSVACSAP